jgi:hypothetical protein
LKTSSHLHSVRACKKRRRRKRKKEKKRLPSLLTKAPFGLKMPCPQIVPKAYFSASTIGHNEINPGEQRGEGNCTLRHDHPAFPLHV